MATSSVAEYVGKELTGGKVNDDGKTVQVSLGSSASGKLDDTSVARDWVITGISNANVSLIATGSGNDELNFSSSIGGAEVNVGSGKDSVIIGGDFVNTSLVGGEGDKTIVIKKDLDPSYISLSGSSVAGSGNDSISVGGSVLDSTIDAGAGRDSIYIGVDSKNSIIRSGADNDIVTIGGAVSASTIDLGAGRDSLNIVGAVQDSTIDAGDGFDAVTIGGASNSKVSLGAGNDSLAVSAAISDTSIYGGDGNDVVSLSGATYSTVDLGAGNDVVSLTGGAYADVDIALGAGKDTINTAAGTGKVSITDYDVLNDVVVGTPAGYTATGDVTFGAGATVNVSKTGEFYAVQTSGAGYVAWGDEDGSTINLTDWNKVATVDGTINADAADLIIGGKKVDAIALGANDSVYGGAGNDVIANAANATQEYVGLASAGGRDTVTTFQDITAAVDKDEADVLYLFENNISSLKLEAGTTGVVAKIGSASVELGTVGNADRINVKDNSGTTYEVEYVDGLDSVTSATDELADFYYAKGTAAQLDFSSVSDTLVVDLGNRGLNVNGTDLTNTDGAFYYGDFASVTGAADNTVLLGAADAKETLTAGAGDTTLWGGGKKADVLQHGAGTTNTVTFYFGDGDGADTITSSNWAASDTSDVLWLGTSSVKSVKNDGANTTISLSDGSKATLSGFSATDTAIKVSFDGNTTMQAKVGKSGASNTWTYDENVTAYLGGSKNTLNVGSSVDDANIWLDGSQGKVFDSVTTVNASSNSGTVVLAGGAGNETLIAGTGNSSLWGGSAGNDVLVGNSTGSTTFYFGNGNGNDVISASNTDDKVVLYNTALTDVKAVDDSKTGVLKVTLNDGSSLTVNNTTSSVNTFQLADGSTWKYDASKKSWSQG
ncbi:beta strand repeat-containing protein [Selenomonas sp. KH1T6]|uniref:beta strand repeat-containing protein n=1 Tax=Selenomonas sp. KH1T6 TaxID=3158784 RepID=UPI0008A7BB74|nr:hypothetical protein SAMN05216583_106137 [Selenomonas ruminantium]